MAGQKEIRSKIKSVRSTRKITRTMEMVAASKMKRAMDRVTRAQEYLTRMQGILNSLQGTKVEHPLLEARETVKRSMILLITANRGLCGGYNTNLIRLAKRMYDEKRAAGIDTQLYLCGRKGVAYFKFRDIPAFKIKTDLTDRPTFEDAQALAEELMHYYESGEVDEINVVYSHYISAGKQPATAMQLLPLKPEAGDGETGGAGDDFIFEPDPETLLKTLIPLSIKNTMFRALIEAVACEQFARRAAMKSATDNAQEMERMLVLNYNKARQAQITKEILEIVGGAEALK